MFLKNSASGDRVEVLDTATLFDPTSETVRGRYHAGEEMQDPDDFSKADLVFLSGEALPQCWTDIHYRS